MRRLDEDRRLARERRLDHEAGTDRNLETRIDGEDHLGRVIAHERNAIDRSDRDAAQVDDRRGA
jgi:hypothetical protein